MLRGGGVSYVVFCSLFVLDLPAVTLWVMFHVVVVASTSHVMQGSWWVVVIIPWVVVGFV